MTELALVLFVGLQVAGIIILVVWLRNDRRPIPRADPGHIFRVVHREDRAAYARVMRRTYAVALRDLSRPLNALVRDIGKALLPATQRLADKIREVER